MSAEKAADAPPFRLRILPVLTAILLGAGLHWLAGEAVDFARHYSHLLVPSMADRLGWSYAQQGVQLVLALIAIGIMKWLAPADYGLHMPAGQSYAWQAVVFGVLLGVLMTLADFAPSILSHTAPRLGYPLTAGSVAGWLGYYGIYVGPTDEVLFRSLIVTYLTVAMPGRVHIRGFEMNGAGIVAAALYALYAPSFITQPFAVALAEMVVSFMAGVLFAYWLEKSKSVLAPILGHNASAATEYALVLVMIALWA